MILVYIYSDCVNLNNFEFRNKIFEKKKICKYIIMLNMWDLKGLIEWYFLKYCVLVNL